MVIRDARLSHAAFRSSLARGKRDQATVHGTPLANNHRLDYSQDGDTVLASPVTGATICGSDEHTAWIGILPSSLYRNAVCRTQVVSHGGRMGSIIHAAKKLRMPGRLSPPLGRLSALVLAGRK